MDIDTPEASASCSSNSSVAMHQPYRPAPASLDEVFYANYPVVQDTPVGQPIEDWRYVFCSDSIADPREIERDY